MNTSRFLLYVLLVLTASIPAIAQGTYTQIDYPGAVQTCGNGINAAGDVVGTYIDTSNVQHGFLFSGGKYTNIDSPSGGWTYLNGINDNGKIVGYGGIAFLYDIHNQTFTNIGFPNIETYPFGINNLDTVVGFVLAGNSSYGLHEVGFELTAQGQWRRIRVAGANSTVPWGISTSGVISGYGFLLDNSSYNFASYGGKYKFLTLEGIVLGINPQGTAVVGYYDPSGGASGFVYQNGTLTTLHFPGSTETIALNINSVGQVAGDFIDASGKTHGFLLDASC